MLHGALGLGSDLWGACSDFVYRRAIAYLCKSTDGSNDPGQPRPDFYPSKLETSRQQQLEKYFAAHGGDDVEVFFRREERFVGANALTLSGTTVVFTDAIVNLLEKDEQLLAVFLHELGHARLRHVEQTLLQSVGWAVLLTFITGDVGGVGELLRPCP